MYTVEYRGMVTIKTGQVSMTWLPIAGVYNDMCDAIYDARGAHTRRGNQTRVVNRMGEVVFHIA